MPDEQIKVRYEDHMGSDLTVANAARVSYGKRSDLEETSDGNFKLRITDKRLIQFLARGMQTDDANKFSASVAEMGARACTELNVDSLSVLEDMLWTFRDTGEHKSPFNHCFVSFVVEAPIFVARQLVKHEYLPWNEMSGRYIELDQMFTPTKYRSKVRDKKQGSGKALKGEHHDFLTALFSDQNVYSFQAYKDAIAMGLCEEQARGLLPLNTMTQWWWSGSLGAFAKMSRLRLAPDAQYESQLVARQISEKMLELFPESWKALVLREFN